MGGGFPLGRGVPWALLRPAFPLRFRRRGNGNFPDFFAGAFNRLQLRNDDSPPGRRCFRGRFRIPGSRLFSAGHADGTDPPADLVLAVKMLAIHRHVQRVDELSAVPTDGVFSLPAGPAARDEVPLAVHGQRRIGTHATVLPKLNDERTTPTPLAHHSIRAPLRGRFRGCAPHEQTGFHFHHCAFSKEDV